MYCIIKEYILFICVYWVQATKKWSIGRTYLI